MFDAKSAMKTTNCRDPYHGAVSTVSSAEGIVAVHVRQFPARLFSMRDKSFNFEPTRLFSVSESLPGGSNPLKILKPRTVSELLHNG